MSRQFDTTAGADFITFSPGSNPPDQGPITIAVLAKASSVAGFTGWMYRGNKTGTAVTGFLTSNNAGPKLFAENDFGNGVSGLSTSWRWYVMSKAAGSALPRIHVWDLSGAWSHTDNSANVGDGTGAVDTVYVGGNGSGANGWRGSIAVVAAWASQLNDAAIEAAMTLRASDTFAATPGWMVRLNQSSTATSVTDDTGGGGNQSAITGTSIDADDPPGYSYALTNNVDGTVAQTDTFTGSVTAALTLSTSAAQTTTLAGSVTADAPRGTTTSQTVAFAGSATGQVIANASVTQALTVSGLVTPEPAIVVPAARGNGWNSLLSIYRQNEADTQRFLATPITECPFHLYQLEPGPKPGTVHCVFGGHFMDLHGNPALI